MTKPKLFVVSQPFYYAPFREMFNLTDNLKEANVIMFTGGEDVSPKLYGEAKGKHTFCNEARDDKEVGIFLQTTVIPKLGICRGAQFLCVMSGGRLVQHITGHTLAGNHEVMTKEGRRVFMSSTHHQMMAPFLYKAPKYELLAWAEGLSDKYIIGNNIDITSIVEMRVNRKEPEIVYFPQTNSLCIQPHPETMDLNSKGVEYCRKLVKEYLL